jgi:serine/threonine-protein kinase
VEPHTLLDSSSRYQIVSRLGAGGMGQLYWALKLGAHGTRARVVLKTSHKLNPREVRWLAHEADLGMAAAGPGIVGHRAFFEAGGRGWLELEPVDGIDLAGLHRRARAAGQRVPPFVAVGLVAEALEALGHVARAGIVHRDVSPRNIMVSATTARVTLVDFGIARRVGVELDPTFGRSVVGKVGYMPPEQVRGELVEPSADLFAASAVLWSLLVGRPPFGQGDPAAVLARVMADAREPPSRYTPNLPPALDEVVLAGLAPRRADRPATADELRDVLLGLLPGLLPPAAGPDPRRAIARWMRTVEPAEAAEETRWAGEP